VRIEKFWGTKSSSKYLEGLERKVEIFLRTKNIFNPYCRNKKFFYILFLDN